MRRSISWGFKALPVIALVSAVGVSVSAWSEDAVKVVDASGAKAVQMRPDVAAGAKIFAEGKGEAPACLSCHGEQGLGDDNMGTPRLAGQGFAYLRKQLHDFAADKRTDTTMGVMNDIARALSDQDKLDVSAHEFSIDQSNFASASNMSEIKDGGAVPVGIRHSGKAIVFSGIPERGVPACQSCHQYNGRGAAPIYPTIGGQRYVYLVAQLQKWREGSRENDMLGQMRAVAKGMTDEDIYNVATYLTSAPVRTPGNPEMPHDVTPKILEAIAH